MATFTNDDIIKRLEKVIGKQNAATVRSQMEAGASLVRAIRYLNQIGALTPEQSAAAQIAVNDVPESLPKKRSVAKDSAPAKRPAKITTITVNPDFIDRLAKTIGAENAATVQSQMEAGASLVRAIQFLNKIDALTIEQSAAVGDIVKNISEKSIVKISKSAVEADIPANDAVVDLYMERAIDLIRLESGTRDKVWALLKNLENDIVKAINKIDIRGVDASGHQRNRLSKLLQAVRSSVQATYRGANTLLAKEMREVADIEGTWTANAINVATHAEFADSGVSRQFLATLASDVLIQGAPTKDWWGRQAAGLADRFGDEMRRGVALGENNSQLVDRVRGRAGMPGLMQVSRTSAERLVRSSVQTAANAAREATYEKNTDLIKALQWHATLDTRTSIYCITRDGHQYGPTDHDAMDGGPPWEAGPGALHWGCRSTSVPVLKNWKELGIDAEEVSKTTRASMDGQVAENLNFEEWLKKQSIARQNDVLGQGKADLWRDGKIKFRDLLDQSGRPLTTEELRAKAAKSAEAAKRAADAAKAKAESQQAADIAALVDHRGDTSALFKDQVYGAVRRLSPNVLTTLINAGQTIVTERTTIEFDPSLKHVTPRGWASGTGWQNADGFHRPWTKQAVITEYYERMFSPGTLVRSNRVPGVTLHEVGHAFDQALQNASEQPLFVAAYRKDATAIPVADRPRLEYFLQSGDAGPSEAFAELFAWQQGAGSGPDIRAFFPNALAVMEGLTK